MLLLIFTVWMQAVFRSCLSVNQTCHTSIEDGREFFTYLINPPLIASAIFFADDPSSYVRIGHP